MDNAIIDNIANSLKCEVILLNLKWAIYKNSFEDKSRKHLLTEIAPIIFTIFQKLLLDDIAITLCRITDPAESGSHQNNTLYQLLSENEINKICLDNVKQKLEPVRRLRNKFLAHRDLDETLCHFLSNTTDGTTNLDLNFPLHLDEIEQVIREINRIINTTLRQNVMYEHIRTPYGPDGGVKRLIDNLKVASFYSLLLDKKKLDPSDYHDEWQNFKHKDA